MENNKKNKNNNGLILILSIIVSFICGTLGSYFVITMFPSSATNVVKNITESQLVETSIADSVDKVIDAVVAISAYKNETLASSGTGFVYKTKGDKAYILTNNHVVSGADKVEVILSDNTVIEATILGNETYSDIAVLSVKNADNIKVADINTKDNLRVGDTVFSVGSPMGAEYSGTVTKGILSGKDRLVEVSFSGSTADYYMKVLQTDAAINPGNSGGPLLNVNGEVIGVTSLKLVQDEVEGMGFAIPIEDALHYAGIFESGKKVERPYIGISMLDVTDTYTLWQQGITIPKDVTEGVVVLEVQKDSPAQKAGLKSGDIIIELAKEETKTLAEFRYELYRHEPKETIELKYLRDGKEKTTKITLSTNEQ